MNIADYSQAARRLIRKERHGVLSTISSKMNGWPFGSLTPYALDAGGEPIILLSGLAEHTRNLSEDPRVSLFIQDSDALDNPQTGARVTLLANAEPAPEDEREELGRLYLGHFPDSAGLFQLGDFNLYRLKLGRARFIGGFGQAAWLDAEDLMK